MDAHPPDIFGALPIAVSYGSCASTGPSSLRMRLERLVCLLFAMGLEDWKTYFEVAFNNSLNVERDCKLQFENSQYPTRKLPNCSNRADGANMLK